MRFQDNGGIQLQEPVVKNYKSYHFKLLVSFKVHNQLHYNVKS